MCQAILVFEAILFGLSIPILVHLADVPTGVAVAVGSVLAVLALVTTGLFRRGAVGDVLGWVVQVGFVALGLLHPAFFFVGGMFALLYWGGWALGRKIVADRERWAAEGSGPA